MAGTVFEVHTLKGGVWQMDSSHQSREAAMETAKLLHAEGHLQGVKVIKDVFDEKTQLSKELVVFDTSKSPKDKAPPPPPPEAKPAAAPGPKADVDFKGGGPKGEKKSDTSTALKAVLWLGLLIAFAGAVLWLTGGLKR